MRDTGVSLHPWEEEDTAFLPCSFLPPSLYSSQEQGLVFLNPSDTRESHGTEQGRGASFEVNAASRLCKVQARMKARTAPLASPLQQQNPGNRLISSLAVSGSFSSYLCCFFCSFCLPQMHSAGQAALEGIKGPAGRRPKSAAVPRHLPCQLPATRHAARESHVEEVPGLTTVPGVTSPSAASSVPNQSRCTPSPGGVAKG